MGEVCAAWIVPAAGTAADTTEIMAWSRERMANFKVPRKIALVKDLPRNATGKVQKFLLPEIEE